MGEFLGGRTYELKLIVKVEELNLRKYVGIKLLPLYLILILKLSLSLKCSKAAL